MHTACSFVEHHPCFLAAQLNIPLPPLFFFFTKDKKEWFIYEVVRTG